MAVFSDTTNKNGLIQIFEFWTRMKDGTVSGNATLLKQITARINSAFERIMPILLCYSDHIRWDDINHTNKPVGTFNIVSGQADYKITADDGSLDILNVTDVRILTSSSGTEYETLEKMTLDDATVLDAVSPNPSNTGVPTHWVENGNIIYLYPEPDYSATNGAKVFFSRIQDYFTSSDTTQEPGIPQPFHELLALHAALDWNMVNRTSDGNLITLLRERIKGMEDNLRDFTALRNPTRTRATMDSVSYQ